MMNCILLSIVKPDDFLQLVKERMVRVYRCLTWSALMFERMRALD